MIRAMVQATLSENDGNRKNAETQYQSTIELAESFGPFADQFQAIAYMGLSRLSADKGMKTQAKRYARNAENYTDYRFILGD